GSSTTSRRYAPSPSHPSCPWWTAPLPPDVLCATVCPITGSGSVLLTGTGRASEPAPTTSPSILQAWQTAAELRTDYYGWVPDEIEVHGNEATLVTALVEGRLRVISDGSFKNGLGTAAVQLLVRIACDGLSATEMAFEDRQLSPTDAQFDLVSPIREAILRSSVDWLPQHVYGHLNKSNLFDKLSWWEKRNLEVDGMMVEYRKELEAANHLIAPNPRFFTKLAALYVADTKQSRLDPQFIQECVTLPALRLRWRDKGTISEAESEVALDPLGRAMRSLPAGLQRWSTKHCVGMCGTGKFKVLWGLETSAACPRCGDFEDHLHVPRCRAALATAEWDRRTAAFSAWLDLQLTGPSIKKSILQLLHGVCAPTSPSPRTISPSVRPAFLAQQVIESQGLLEGLIASSWLPLQQQHYDKIRCRRSVSLWASRLSQQLFSIGFYMWEQRNSVQHSDDNVQLRERHSTVNEGIHSQFDMGPDDLPKEIQPMLTSR
ncbi:unnamed protein product, partial [Cylindrotheca closterium]